MGWFGIGGHDTPSSSVEVSAQPVDLSAGMNFAVPGFDSPTVRTHRVSLPEVKKWFFPSDFALKTPKNRQNSPKSSRKTQKEIVFKFFLFSPHHHRSRIILRSQPLQSSPWINWNRRESTYLDKWHLTCRWIRPCSPLSSHNTLCRKEVSPERGNSNSHSDILGTERESSSLSRNSRKFRRNSTSIQYRKGIFYYSQIIRNKLKVSVFHSLLSNLSVFRMA